MQPLEFTTDFSIKNAHFLAQASQVAYSSEHQLRNKLGQWRFKDCLYIEERDTQCYIANHDLFTLIAFRGTEANIEDWITDLNFELRAHTMGAVHSGFDRAFNQVWPGIKYHLSQLDRKPIFITGHSLGAALAGLCAAQCRLSGIEVRAVYSFGQPRMGNKTFQKNYDRLLKDCSYRIVNNNDVVTRVPPRALNYQHAGTLQYFKESGELSSMLSDWSMFLDRLNGRVEDILEWGTDGIKDHAVSEYVRLCEQSMETEPA